MLSSLRAAKVILLGGALCLDYCNTVEKRESTQPLHFMNDYDDLLAWLLHVGVLSADEAAVWRRKTDLADEIYQNAIQLREALYRIFHAVYRDEPIPGADLDTLNGVLQAACAHRQLRPNGSHFVWEWTARDLLWPIALSASELLTSPLLSRLKQCPGCHWLFLDQSKNRSRNWCSMEYCGNRAKAKRFYQRAKAKTTA